MVKKIIFAGFLFCIIESLAIAGVSGPTTSRIDRYALVTRHNVTLDEPNSLIPLSVGNGEFAFTADITGLQTFPDFHEQGMAICTQSHWGWHTAPNPNGYKMSDALEDYEVAGRKVPYASSRRASIS